MKHGLYEETREYLALALNLCLYQTLPLALFQYLLRKQCAALLHLSLRDVERLVQPLQVVADLLRRVIPFLVTHLEKLGRVVWVLFHWRQRVLEQLHWICARVGRDLQVLIDDEHLPQ